jgi:hypothetical protein
VTAGDRRARALAVLAVGAVLAFAIAVRLPLLLNASLRFDSDEAVNALVMQRLVEHGELRLHNWDATYFGIVEGLMAIPFTWFFGYEPIAFKLAAVAGALLQLIASYLLACRLFGRGAGVVAALLGAVVSPMVVHWSTVAAGGYLLVVAWGTVSFLGYDSLRRHGWLRSRWRLFAAGLVLGFGLYVYELYLLYLAGFAAAASWAVFGQLRTAWRQRPRWHGVAAEAIRLVDAAAAVALGMAIGWAPTLALHIAGQTGAKTPSYAVASWRSVLADAHLLLTECVPAFFHLPVAPPRLRLWTGDPEPLQLLAGAVVAACYAAGVLMALRRTGRAAGAPASSLPPTTVVLAFLVPLIAFAFAISGNATNVQSSRYLLPLLTTVPVLTAGWLAWLYRRQRLLAAALATLLVLFPLAGVVRWYRGLGYLHEDLRIRYAKDPLSALLADLDAEGIRGGYTDYWDAYRATFLSGGRVVFTAVDWDREPRYTRIVDHLEREAYFFDSRSPRSEEGLHLQERLSRSRPATVWDRPPYKVYFASDDRRLLAPLRALEHPRAAVAVREHLPAVVPPGGTLDVPVRVTNLGHEVWPAVGRAGGSLRVSMSYQWYDESGRRLEARTADRSLLPRDLGPGETAELEVQVRAPERPGRYRLVLTPVQDDVAWFDEKGAGGADFSVVVAPPAAPGTTG